MSKDTYVVLDIEGKRDASHVEDWKRGYNPARWEEVKIEFTVPPEVKTRIRKTVEKQKDDKTWPETERRKGFERRSDMDRRMGSEDRRSWQESRWIGAADCRSGRNDRRQSGDRRKNPDRRRK